MEDFFRRKARISEMEKEAHLLRIDTERGKQQLAASKRDIASLRRDLSAKQQEVIDSRDEVDRLEAEIQLGKIAGGRFAPRARAFAGSTGSIKDYHPDRNSEAAEFMKDLNELFQEIKRLR